jgi:hypothetical protein
VRAIALGLVVVGMSTACSAQEIGLRVSGNRLVDSRGHEIGLRGVNRSGAEYACVSGPGLGLSTFAGPTDKPAIDAMTAWGINAVRIPLNEDCWLGINGAPRGSTSAAYRAAVVDYVGRLHQAGLYVVLDLHWSAPGSHLATGQQEMADLDHSPAFWSSVAQTFKDDPFVVFDLYNEPRDISWPCWRDGCKLSDGWRTVGMQRLVDTVRATGARQPIIVSGIHWSTDLSSWLKYRPRDPANRLIAGIHVFDFSFCGSAACWGDRIAAVARVMPVVVSEVGQRQCDSDFVGRFADWAEARGISYLGWSWNPAGCRAPSLIDSWDGRPTASGRQLRQRLRARPPARLGRSEREAVADRWSNAGADR